MDGRSRIAVAGSLFKRDQATRVLAVTLARQSICRYGYAAARPPFASKPTRWRMRRRGF